METPAASGRHEYWYDRDLLGLRFRGRISRQDMVELRDALNNFTEQHPRCYLLLDMSQCTGIDPEARRFMATWSSEPNRGLQVTLLYGIGAAMRAIVTLTINAVRLLGRLNSEIEFTRDETEARAWADQHRAKSGG